MDIRLENITKKYGEFKAVDNVSLYVEQGELVALLGSSGCGKTTLLKMIAGLIEVDEGKIFLGNRDITECKPQERNAAMVFQNYALFPHFNVFDNIAYGLNVKKIQKKEIEYKVNLVLDKVELTGLGDRRVQELSGGQKQRVALARALVIEPDILLFDEPLSNLDESLRVSMRKEIRKIQKEFNITAIYVTHDQKEAMGLADRIAVMNDGVICQIDKPDQIFNYPKNLKTAEFIGHPNIVNLEMLNENSRSYIDLFGEKIYFKSKKETINLLIRPEEITISDNGIEATIINSEVIGSVRRYLVKVKEQELSVDVINKVNAKIYKEGKKVSLKISEDAIHIIE